MSSIAGIRTSCDAAVTALDAAWNSIGDEIALTTQRGSRLDSLVKRQKALADQRAHLRAAATDAVLALPAVIAAAAALGKLSEEMTAVAAKLPAATDVLTSTGKVLELGQQVADLVTGGSKPAG